MTNQEIKTVGQTIAAETQIGGNTAERVGGVIEGIGEALDNKDAAVGYYLATMSGSTIYINASSYRLGTGGNLRAKMPAAATTACTLTVGNANAVQLWYNGAAVSADNSWEAGEIVTIFYDGTRFMASNSQGGGGQFGSGEKIKDILLSQVLGAGTDAITSQKGVSDAIFNEIDISSIDSLKTLNDALAPSSSLKPTYYTVTATLSNVKLKVGSMAVISDNMRHVVTEIMATHYTLDDTGTLTNEHSDAEIFFIYRSVKLSGGTLPDPAGTWTKWRYVNSSVWSTAAEKIKYDNSASGLAAEDVQGALDLLVNNIANVGKDLTSQFIFTNGVGIRMDNGTESSNSNMKASDFFIIPDNTQSIEFNLPVVLSMVVTLGLAFYDDSKQYMTDAGVPMSIGSNRGMELHTKTIPQGARYIRATYWSASAQSTYNIPDFKIVFYADSVKLSELISGKTNLNNIYPIYPLFSNGYAINKNGVEVANTYMMASSPVVIPDGVNLLRVTIPVVLSLSSTNPTGLVFLDEHGNVLSFVPMIIGVSRGSQVCNLVIPDNAYSFRTTYWNDSSIQSYQLGEFSASFSVREKINMVDIISWITGTGYVLSQTGEYSGSITGALHATDFIAIKGYEALAIRVPIVLSNRYSAGIAFYNANKDFILNSGISIKEGETRDCEIIYPQIPDGAEYIRITYWTDDAVETYNLDAFMFDCIADINIGQELTEIQKKIEDIPSNIDTTNDKEPRFTLAGDCDIYKSESSPYVPTISDTVASVYEKYDLLMQAHSERMHKYDLGIASDGTSHLYAYEIEPMLPSIFYRDNQGIYYDYEWDEYPVQTIILASGVHGNEKGAVASLYNLIKQMLEDTSNKETQFILNNAFICIVPIVNPYGFTNAIRYNANNLDINNDYGTWSQAESVLIRDYVASKPNVTIFLDCHNTRSRPSVWAEAHNDVAKNFLMSTYPYLLKNWVELAPTVLDHLPIFSYFLNGWSGVASNYFFSQGIISMTVESCASYQKNIVEDERVMDVYDSIAVRMGMDVFANAIIHNMKAACVSMKFYKGMEEFRVFGAPATLTISNGQTGKLLALATGFVLSYRWYYSDNNGSTWTQLVNNNNPVGTPLLYIPYADAVNNRLYRCLVGDAYGHTDYFGNTKIIKV